MKVYSGSSNPKLAKEIADNLGVHLGTTELSCFGNSESRVYVTDRLAGNDAIVVQSFSAPADKNIIEFCLLVDALKRLGVERITAVIPWFAYCIQDKVFRHGEPLSAKVIAKIINTQKLNKIITLDLHNETIAGFFDLPFIHLSAVNTFIDYFMVHKTKIDLVVSPDVGGLKRATKFSQALNLPLAVINKKRDLKTGKVAILGINEEVKGQNVMIVDDFISSGQTLIAEIKYLRSKGAGKINACVTHHFYINGVQKKISESELDLLYITDTIAPLDNQDKINKKLKIVSVANLISEVIG